MQTNELSILLALSEIKDYQSLNQVFLQLNINDNDKSDFLSRIDHQKHSYVYCCLINTMKKFGILFQKTQQFLIDFNIEQILQCSQQFYELSQKFMNFAIEQGVGIKIVKTLQIAIQKLQQDQPAFTIIHELFAQLCIRTKMYKASLVIIEQPLFQILKQDFRENSIACYYYYCGILFCGLKKWKQAIESFYFCLQINQHSLYEVQVQALKKLQIVQIISNHQKQKDLQKILFVSQKNYYQNLNKIDCQNKFLDYKSKNIEQLHLDQNIGLFDQIYKNILFKSIENLQKTYESYLIEQLIKDLNYQQDIKPILYELNEKEQILKIDSKNQAIQFLENPSFNYQSKIINPLDISIQKVILTFDNQLNGLAQEFQKHGEIIFAQKKMSQILMSQHQIL